jgi:hypothetical protein
MDDPWLWTNTMELAYSLITKPCTNSYVLLEAVKT